MSNIKWEDGAVCFANGEQYIANGFLDDVLLTYTLAFADFQLNEIRTGDYISASELDTEQKYNDTVEVFGLFGFEKINNIVTARNFNNTNFSVMLTANVNQLLYITPQHPDLRRKLSYTQLMAIGKVKRAMLEREKSAPKTAPNLTKQESKTATDYLQECMEVQKERGEQYNSKGTGERSFAAIAEAFTAITGKKLVGSDIALIQQILKAVRQYSDPTRVHEDSLLDLVSYASLWAEELNKENNND